MTARLGSVLGWICAVLRVLFLARSSMSEMLDVAVAVAGGLVLFGIARWAGVRTQSG